MKRQEMKRTLKQLAKPVKNELFEEVGFTKDEMLLMKYLYIDKIEQWWVSDELGISLPTLTNWHNNCIEQLISYFNFEKYKMDNKEDNKFQRFFNKN